MYCTKHSDKEAAGACVYCGKFYCVDCLVEVKGKMYCKDDLSKVFDAAKESGKSNNPMVFMNAGGGASSSSSGSGYGYPSNLIPFKSKTVAGILGIFFGGLGFHKFYLGKVGTGIMYLIFCWTGIPSVVGLIEGIMYLTKSDYEFALKYGGRPA